MKVLVAGATGTLGIHVVQALLTCGHQVRALSRRSIPSGQPTTHESVAADLTAPETLVGACSGIDAVIACAGASLQIGSFKRRERFLAVDYFGNRNLLAEARRTGVARFVYVSLAGVTTLAKTELVQAHERFVDELSASGIPFTIIRPTSFFATFARFLPLARAGLAPLLGSGHAITNPIHEAEVAQACVEALTRTEDVRAIGGPEEFTRHRLAEMAFDAIGKPPRLLSIPPSLIRAAVPLCKPIHPRISALLHFGIEVTQVDVVAPHYGKRRLGDYLRTITAAAAPASAQSR